MDSAAHDIIVQTQTRFTTRGEPYRVAHYSYFCGPNGPFTLEYPLGQDTAEEVTADIDAQCAKLRAVGALPAAEA